MQTSCEAKALTIMIIDIDFFKNYNDHYRHLLGDETLIKVAGALADIASKYNAFAGRWGDEVFVIVSQHAQHFTEYLCERSSRFRDSP